ncbi:hypothetical protein BDN72DRAFT_965728 [Pluteus cervinus]|uniref:Uncharacterized protein n=1 Tax=Pluteus cervinus TaxID=181527 RepID=A0ACD3A4L3_9AGAR|nr:hypothetical protein BDN72DRAFT_965728 [Pluteus cervinus]
MSSSIPNVHKDHLEPRLPADLERIIFDDVARNNRGSIPKLMLVCQRAKYWTETILYSVIIRNEDPSRPAYHPPIKRLPSYAHHVRHLLVYNDIEQSVIQDHLRLCKNMINVALWHYNQSRDILELLEGLPHLRSLVVHLFATFPGGPPTYELGKSRMFRGLTHLEILDDVEKFSADQIRSLGELDNLTHFALNSVRTDQIVLDILKVCQRVQVLVLHDSRFLDDWATFPKNRVVFGRSRVEDHVRDWVAFAEGRWCFWDEAEEQVQAEQNAHDSDS